MLSYILIQFFYSSIIVFVHVGVEEDDDASSRSSFDSSVSGGTDIEQDLEG